MIECGLGCYVITIRDHESRLQAVVECDTWADIPSMLDSLLGSGKLPWKPFKSFRKKEKKLKEGE